MSSPRASRRTAEPQSPACPSGTEAAIQSAVDAVAPPTRRHHQVIASHLRVFLRDQPLPDGGEWTPAAIRAAITERRIQEHLDRLAERGCGRSRLSSGRTSLRRIAGIGRRVPIHRRSSRNGSALRRDGGPLLEAASRGATVVELYACLARLRQTPEVAARTFQRAVSDLGPALMSIPVDPSAWHSMLSTPPARSTGDRGTTVPRTARSSEEVGTMSGTVASRSRNGRPSRSAVIREAEARRTARLAAERIADMSAGTWPQWDSLTPAVRERADAYRPRRMEHRDWARLRPAALRLVSLVDPPSPGSAATLLANLTPYLTWRAQVAGPAVGPLPLDAVGTREDLEDWLVLRAALGDPDGTLATRRCEVRRALDALAGKAAPQRIAYQPVAAPYTQTEIDRMHAVARFQPELRDRITLAAIVALCAGAGLESGEAGLFAPAHATRIELPGGAWTWLIDVQGARPRRVPVMLEHRDLLTSAMDLHARRWARTTPLLKQRAKGTVSYAIANADSADGMPVEIHANRLRNTWLVTQMQSSVPIAVLLRAAGLKSGRALGDLLQHCPEAAPERVTWLLAGAGAEEVAA